MRTSLVSTSLSWDKKISLKVGNCFFLILLLLLSLFMLTNIGTVYGANPTKVAFSSGTSQSLSTFEVSLPITVQLQDSNGNAATAKNPGVVVSLSTNSSGQAGGAFASDINGNTKITLITIPTGSASASFYYYDLTVGSPLLTASSSGLTSKTTQFSINTSRLSFASGASQTVPSYCLSQPVTVQLQDAQGNPITVPGAATNLNINLASNSTGGAFCSDNNGNTVINFVTISTGSNSVNFYYYDLTAGTSTITATASALLASTQFAISQSKLTFISGATQWLLLGSVSQQLEVQLQDYDGNPLSMPSHIGAMNVNLVSNSTGPSGGFFYSDSGGNTEITNIQLSRGSVQSSFFYSDSALGKPVITASASVTSISAAITQFTIDLNPQPTPTPTPTPVPTPAPTVSPEPTATSTPVPTPTPLSTPSPTPNLTSTPTSVIHSTSTASPQPVQTYEPIPLHDIAISQITPSTNQIKFGQPLSFEVTIKNKGTASETFSVTLYGNNTIIGNQTIAAMPSNSEKTLSFQWDTSGFAKENVYSIKAITSEIKNDSDPESNIYTLNYIKQTEHSTVPVTLGVFGGTSWVYLTLGLAGFAATCLLIIKKRKPKHPENKLCNSNQKSFQGINDITDGGFPDAYSVMVVGEADSEKSAFCQQLANGYLKQGKPILYVTYDQFPEEVRSNMKELGWDIFTDEQKGNFIFLDAYSSTGGKQSNEKYSVGQPFALSELGIGMSLTLSTFNRNSAKVFLDSTSPLFTRIDPSKVVEFLQDRIAKVKGENSMFFFTVGKGTIQENFQRRLEEMVDCVIELEVQKEKKKIVRRVHFKKLRGQKQSNFDILIGTTDELTLSILKNHSKSQK